MQLDRKPRKLVSGNRAHSEEDRGGNEYMTPPAILEALMRVEALPETIWEPACGTGNLVRLLEREGRDVVATDISGRYATGWRTKSFLDFETAPAFDINGAKKPLAVVTNPPFSHFSRFAQHALTMVPDVYLLGRLNYLEGGQRDPARDRLLDRGGLRAVYVLRERPKDMHREGWEGNKSSFPMTLAWFCWRRGFSGKARVGRVSALSTKPLLPPPAPKPPKGYDPNTIDMFKETTRV